MLLRTSLFYLKRKGLFLLPLFLALGAYCVHQTEAQSAGISGRASIGCGAGPTCHAPQSNTTTIVTISTQATQIVAGQTYTFQLVVKNPKSTLKAGGCDIAADNGILDIIAGQGLSNQFLPELTHSQPKLFATGTDSAVWKFKYTAPDVAGWDTIRAAGNAVNHNGENDFNDLWNLTTYGVNVVATGGVAGSSKATAGLQVYPNPSSGHITLASGNLHGNGEVIISDASGNVKMTQSISLDQNSQFDLSGFPNGHYFLRLIDGLHEPMMRSIEIKK